MSDWNTKKPKDRKKKVKLTAEEIKNYESARILRKDLVYVVDFDIAPNYAHSYFGKFGEVKNVTYSDKDKGYYVTFMNQEDASRCIYVF